MLDKNNEELTLIHEYNIEREVVFKAWTDEKKLAQWWGPYGVTNPVCKFEDHPNGSIDIVMLAGRELGELAGNRWPMTGTVKVIIAPKKLIYEAEAIMNKKPVLKTLTTVNFEKTKKGTRLRIHIVVTEKTPEAEGPLAGMKIGWNQSLDKLEEYLLQK